MWWKVLGVAQHAEIAEIKKAYSALIKQYRPEEYPEEFSQIRQAFEYAKKHASKQKTPPAESIKTNEEQNEQPVLAEPNVAIETQPKYQPAEPAVRISAKILEAEQQSLHSPQKNITARNSEESIITILYKWQHSKYKNSHLIDQVLNHDDTHDFMELKRTGHEVFAWLVENVKPATGFLASSINMPVTELAKLNNLFGWSLKERELYQNFEGHDLSLIFYGIASGQRNKQHINPVVMQKVNKKRQNANNLFNKIIDWGTSVVLFYVLIMLFVLFVRAVKNEQYLLACISGVLLYLLIDGLYYAFKGLKRIGLLRKKWITSRSRIWALAIKKVLLGLVIVSVIVLLEMLVFALIYGLAVNIKKDNLVFILLLLLMPGYLAYWLNREVLTYARDNYFKLLKEIEHIRFNLK